MKRSRAMELAMVWHDRQWTDEEWAEIRALPNPGMNNHARVVHAAGFEWNEWLKPNPERWLRMRAAYAAALAKGE